MLNERERIILLVTGILFFIGGIYLLKDISSEINILKRKKDDALISSVISDKLKIIDKTLGLSLKPSTFEYKGDFENPFKLWGEHNNTITENNRESKEYQREKLLLKGILIKENRPLAILEDSNGKTNIVGIGEKIYEQEVISITDKCVLLKDKKGKYELKVEEP
jgi:hypothetical protein